MVLTAFVIAPSLTIIAMWLLETIIDLVFFIYKLLLGLGVLMWFIISFFAQIIYNCWWYIASLANSLVAWVWSGVSLPLQFGLLSLTVTHLVLQKLYYVSCFGCSCIL